MCGVSGCFDSVSSFMVYGFMVLFCWSFNSCVDDGVCFWKFNLQIHHVEISLKFPVNNIYTFLRIIYDWWISTWVIWITKC